MHVNSQVPIFSGWWMGCANVWFCMMFHVAKATLNERGLFFLHNRYNTQPSFLFLFFIFFATCQRHLHQQLRKSGPHASSTSPKHSHTHAPQKKCAQPHTCICCRTSWHICNIESHSTSSPSLPQPHLKELRKPCNGWAKSQQIHPFSFLS